jgi:outer membrane protein OmpA-like peptidoglycan-associated protein
MAFESIFRKAGVALAVGAFALGIGSTAVVQAQVLALGESNMIESAAESAATPTRLVLHGIRFEAHSDKIARSSAPVLDYAIQIIRDNPQSLIYVKPVIYTKVQSSQDRGQGYVESNSELTNRRTQAVAEYLEQRGISAKRLVLLAPGSASHADDEGVERTRSPKNSEVVQLDFASESGSTTTHS